MKVLVTGAAGFIGQHLVRRLRHEGCDVRTFMLPGSAPDWSADTGVQTVEGDIRDETNGSIQTPAIPAAPLRIYNMLNSLVYAVVRRELPRADRLNLFLGDRSFDISRARAELGYQPRVSAAEIVRQTANWYRSQGYLDQDC